MVLQENPFMKLKKNSDNPFMALPSAKKVDPDTWPPMPLQSYPSLGQGPEFQGMQIPNQRPQITEPSPYGTSLALLGKGSEDLKGKQNKFYNLGESELPSSVFMKADLTMEGSDDYKRVIALDLGIDGKDVQVRSHPELGDKTYRIKKDGKWGQERRLEAGGPVEFLAANPSSIPAFGLEILAGFLGLAGGPVGAIGASAVAAMTTRAARLYAGEEAGYNKMSHSDIWAEASLEGLMAVAGGAGADAVIGASRYMFQNPAMKKFFSNISKEQMDAFRKTLDDKLAPMMKERYGIDFTVGQVLQEGKTLGAQIGESTVEQVRKLETSLAKESEPLRKLQDAQSDLLVSQRQGLETGAAPRADKMDLPEVSAQIQRGLAPEDDIVRLQQNADENIRLLNDELSQTFDAPDVVLSAQELRGSLRDARKNARTRAGEPYDVFWNDVGGKAQVVVDTAPIRKVALEHKGKLSKDAFPNMVAEDKDIVNQALNWGKGVKEIDKVVPTTGNVVSINPSKPMINIKLPSVVVFDAQSFKTVNRAITVLKDEKNRLITGKGDTKVKDARFLQDMIDGFTTARDNALDAISPGASGSLKKIDAAYSKTLTNIDTSNVNRILEVATGGKPNMSPLSAIGALLDDSGEAAEAYMKLVNDPNSIAGGALPEIRQGIRSLYKKEVLSLPQSERTLAHESFMRDKGDALEVIMSPDEFSSFNKGAGETFKKIELREARLASEIDNINKSFKTEFSTTNRDLVDFVLQGDKRQTIKNTIELKKFLSDESLDQYKRLRARKMLDDITGTDKMKQQVIDPDKITDVLTKQAGELKTLFGSQYIRDLEEMVRFTDLKNVPQSLAESRDFRNLVAEGVGFMPSVMVFRALFAPPLSKKGLATTAILKVSGKKARAALGEMLANPKQFVALMKAYREQASLDVMRRSIQTPLLGDLLDSVIPSRDQKNE